MTNYIPGHDRALIDRIVDEWRVEFSVSDPDDHIRIDDIQGDPDGASLVTAVTPEGQSLINKFVEAGVLMSRH